MTKPTFGEKPPKRTRRGNATAIADPESGIDPFFTAEMKALDEARHQAWLDEHADYFEKLKQPPKPRDPIHVSRRA